MARALRADGLSTTLSAVSSTRSLIPASPGTQALVRLTGVKSRWVVATAGVIMMIIGVIPKVGAVVAAIPPPVLGGAGFALFGTVAVIGVATLRGSTSTTSATSSSSP